MARMAGDSSGDSGKGYRGGALGRRPHPPMRGDATTMKITRSVKKVTTGKKQLPKPAAKSKGATINGRPVNLRPGWTPPPGMKVGIGQGEDHPVRVVHPAPTVKTPAGRVGAAPSSAKSAPPSKGALAPKPRFVTKAVAYVPQTVIGRTKASSPKPPARADFRDKGGKR